MKIFLDSIGCRLNQSEIEQFAGQFRAVGHEIVASAAEADLVVVNTCAVTAQAASDSRAKIRQAARLSRAEVIATGCWATLETGAAQALPGVSRVVDNLNKERLVGEVLSLPQEVFDAEPLAREPLPGAHLRTRAFIKVQDGCDNHCTFCITRVARGAGRSRTAQVVLADVQRALDGGTQEIVLTGVHLGSWGQDFSSPAHLYDLVQLLLRRADLPRLRLSSLEPWDLDDSFFGLWQDARLCQHLHLPLQSGSGEILRRMARKTTPDTFARLVEAARAVAPQMAVTTDVITGFPGENEHHHAESLAFIRAMNFAGGHAFTYSARPGTPAARMPAQVPPALRKQRNAQVRALFAEAQQQYNAAFIGTEVSVLWESTDAYGPLGWRLNGLTGNYLRVAAYSPQPAWNQFSRVRLERLNAGGLEGVLLG